MFDLVSRLMPIAVRDGWPVVLLAKGRRIMYEQPWHCEGRDQEVVAESYRGGSWHRIQDPAVWGTWLAESLLDAVLSRHADAARGIAPRRLCRAFEDLAMWLAGGGTRPFCRPLAADQDAPCFSSIEYAYGRSERRLELETLASGMVRFQLYHQGAIRRYPFRIGRPQDPLYMVHQGAASPSPDRSYVEQFAPVRAPSAELAAERYCKRYKGFGQPVSELIPCVVFDVRDVDNAGLPTLLHVHTLRQTSSASAEAMRLEPKHFLKDRFSRSDRITSVHQVSQ